MNTVLIGELIRLRYKLLWAKTRSRNGRIALFLAGYLLLVMLIALLATGGFGAAILAVRSGKAENDRARHADRIVPGSRARRQYSWLRHERDLLGDGTSPLSAAAADRRIARHLTGILDPFWFLFLALQLGLMMGLYVLGAGSFWFGLLAVLLLFAANYLLARVVSLFIDQLMQRKGGGAILMVFIMTLSLGPSAVAPLLEKNPAMVTASGAATSLHASFRRGRRDASSGSRRAYTDWPSSLPGSSD